MGICAQGRQVTSDEKNARALACLRHHRAKNTVDAGGITLAVLLEPIVDIAVQPGCDQHLGCAAKLRQFLAGERRDLRIINVGIPALGLTSRDSRQDPFLQCPDL